MVAVLPGTVTVLHLVPAADSRAVFYVVTVVAVVALPLS